MKDLKYNPSMKPKKSFNDAAVEPMKSYMTQ